MYQIGSCRTIQSYSPGGATFPDCFASFSKAVAVTTVARSAVFTPSWASMRPYYWLRLINSTQPIAAVFSTIEFEGFLKVQVAWSFSHIRQVALTAQERASHAWLCTRF